MTSLTTRQSQRGAGALAVVLLLVFTASIALLHLQRGSLVAQRASVHQARAVVAAELAEAGVAWAAGMLNSPSHLGAGCRPDGTGSESFRRRFVEGPLLKAAAAGETGADNITLAVLQCRFVDAEMAWAAGAGSLAPGETSSLPAPGQGLRCDCAEPGSDVPTVPAGEAQWPAFVVTLSRPAPPAGEPADTTMADITVQVSSVGCPHGCSAASATSATATLQGQPTEGMAVARALLRHVNTLQWAPVAPITCAGDCQLEDSTTLINTDLSTAGTLAMAGGRILAAGTVGLQTLPGQPAPLALAAGDAALARLAAADPQCQASAVFSHFFGMTLERFLATSTETATVACTDAASCGSRIAFALQAGWRTLYLPDGLVLDETAPFQALGGMGDGVRLIVGGPVRLRASLALHGLVFLPTPAADALDIGPATVRGAAIGCGPLRLAGTGRITYAADAIGTAGASRWRHGAFVRLPGSWKDF